MPILPEQGLLSSDEKPGLGTKAADLAGTKGEHTNTVEGQVSSKIDQLLGFITL